ncbi:ASF1 family histone chaperone [Asticcacaulis sp. AND118]|uniref:ASF1 family histone chaperone n=1 Tax=Asticcacaulis sp. AND118 TaxID=2840468 RepID=UPI001CFFDEE0|nr:ASF1 family histone chaperone [Asticcacaulis sp. AND118]UDF05213.1 ASF1 family histone chaperone [Asticcacaulis sp. AND118]
MTDKQEQVILRLVSGISDTFSAEDAPVITTPDLSAPENGEYVNLDSPNPRFRVDGPMTNEQFEALRRHIEADNPRFEDVLQFPILDNIIKWLAECGLPETLFYIAGDDGIVPCTTPDLISAFNETPPHRRIFAHHLLNTELSSGSTTKQNHLKEVIVAFLAVQGQLGKATYSNGEAMALCMEVASLISTWRRMQMSTKADVTSTVLTGKRSKQATHSGGVKRGNQKREEAEMWTDRALPLAIEIRTSQPHISQKDLAGSIVANWKGAKSVLPNQERIAQWIRAQERASDPTKRIPPKQKRN